MVNIKIINELNYDEVNYNEIEEVDEITLYDSLDGWIDEEWPIDDEVEYLKTEDELFNLLDDEEEKNKAIDLIAEHINEWGLLDRDMTLMDILSQDANPDIVKLRNRLIYGRRP